MHTQPTRSRGFTLVELLITLALVAVLATLAAPQFQRTIALSQLRSTTGAFAASILQARSEAIRTNQSAYVIPSTGTDFSQGWLVYIDTNANGVYDAGVDTLVSQVSAPSSGVSLMTAQTNKAAFRFDSNGYARQLLGGTGGANGSVSFGLNPNPWGDNNQCIVVAITGRMRTAPVAVNATACPTS